MFGAASGCAVPASAAAVASYVVPERRSSSLSFIFTFFNCGSAFGLLLAGGLISTLGWQSVFLAFGRGGDWVWGAWGEGVERVVVSFAVTWYPLTEKRSSLLYYEVQAVSFYTRRCTYLYKSDQFT